MIWICTDPDNFQYRTKLKNGYTFREFNKAEFPELFKELYDGDLEHDHNTIIDSTTWNTPEYWVQMYLRNNQFSLKEMMETVESYGYTLDDLAKMDAGDELLYEFLFEQNV